MAEGAPLLREYGVCSLIEGSNPSLSAIYYNVNISGMVPLVASLNSSYRKVQRRFFD